MINGLHASVHHPAPRRVGGRRSAGAYARPFPQLADRGGAAGVSGDAGRLAECESTGARRTRVRRAGSRGCPEGTPGRGSQTLSGGATPAGRTTRSPRPAGSAPGWPAAAGNRIRLLRGLLRMEEGAPRRGVTPRIIAAQVCEALNRAGAKYLVIGGVACILHGYARTTEDVDILIERTETNAGRVLKALARVGYGFAAEWAAAEILKRPITVIGDDPAVDVFTVAWKVKYEQAAARSEVVDVEGVSIPLIALDDLIETKRTGRLQDAADIEVLEEIKRLRGFVAAHSREV